MLPPSITSAETPAPRPTSSAAPSPSSSSSIPPPGMGSVFCATEPEVLDLAPSAVADHIRKTCIRSWTWTTKGTPPSDAQASGISVQSTSKFNGIDTLSQIYALDPITGVCSGGKYPRQLSSTECQDALLTLSQKCKLSCCCNACCTVIDFWQVLKVELSRGL